MPLPLDEPWKPEWGGALELYSTVLNEHGIPEPEPMPVKILAPSWNQVRAQWLNKMPIPAALLNPDCIVYILQSTTWAQLSFSRGGRRRQ